MDSFIGVLAAGAVLWGLYHLLKKTAREQAEQAIRRQRQDDLWNEIRQAIAFLDQKRFDEMHPHDFQRARQVLHRITAIPEQAGGLDPVKLAAVHSELEYRLVQFVIPPLRGKEPAQLTEDDLFLIEQAFRVLYGSEVASCYVQLVQDYRKAQLIALKHPGLFRGR